ncbi:hypothetical protein DL93DRAFT_2084449 [Clavulina sp. PMI_390]|nr:hypothetical protein DL93DRAFT_2084449 [Clavulina sp. PMI_390]
MSPAEEPQQSFLEVLPFANAIDTPAADSVPLFDLLVDVAAHDKADQLTNLDLLANVPFGAYDIDVDDEERLLSRLVLGMLPFGAVVMEAEQSWVLQLALPFADADAIVDEEDAAVDLLGSLPFTYASIDIEDEAAARSAFDVLPYSASITVSDEHLHHSLLAALPFANVAAEAAINSRYPFTQLPFFGVDTAELQHDALFNRFALGQLPFAHSVADDFTLFEVLSLVSYADEIDALANLALLKQVPFGIIEMDVQEEEATLSRYFLHALPFGESMMDSMGNLALLESIPFAGELELGLEEEVAKSFMSALPFATEAQLTALEALPFAEDASLEDDVDLFNLHLCSALPFPEEHIERGLRDAFRMSLTLVSAESVEAGLLAAMMFSVLPLGEEACVMGEQMLNVLYLDLLPYAIML